MAWFVHAMPAWTSSIDHLWPAVLLQPPFYNPSKRQRFGVGLAMCVGGFASRMFVVF